MRTTLNAILCCLSFSCSSNLASSHPSSPKEPDRWYGHHWVSSLSACWLGIRKDLRGCLRILTCSSSSQRLRNTVTLGGQKPTPECPSPLATLTFATAFATKKKMMQSLRHALNRTDLSTLQAYYSNPDAVLEKPSQTLMMKTEFSACRAYKRARARTLSSRSRGRTRRHVTCPRSSRFEHLGQKLRGKKKQWERNAVSPQFPYFDCRVKEKLFVLSLLQYDWLVTKYMREDSSIIQHSTATTRSAQKGVRCQNSVSYGAEEASNRQTIEQTCY